MDEIDKIFMKNLVLLKARNYLLEQSPSDLVTISGITEYIVDLTACQIHGRTLDTIPKVPTADEQILKKAIEALEKKLDQKSSPTQIMDDARVLYGVKPWPPRSSGAMVGGSAAAILGDALSTRGTKLR
jgi:hypothetical protein